jgi:hypothetical protein
MSATPATPTSTRPAGRRVLGTISGFVFGLGLIILLQQFGLVPLSAPMLVVPFAMALVGLGLGWPRAA